MGNSTWVDGMELADEELSERTSGRRGIRAALRRNLKLWPPPLHPILFAAYPVLFLYAQNLNDVTTREVVNPLEQALAWGILATLCFGLVFLLDFRRGALVASFTILFWYTYGHVVNLLAGQHLSQNEFIGGWIVVGAVVVLVALLASSRVIGAITSLANVVAIVLVAIVVAQLIPALTAKPAAAAGPRQSGAVVPGDRDVYWFIFDRYGSQTSLDYFAGTHNPLQDFLRSRGFYVADGAHANYSRTTTSITGTMGMNYFTDIAAAQGPASTNLQPLYAVIQHSPVAEFLLSRGYRFINNGSWFGPTQIIGDADENTYTTNPDAETDFSAILDQTTFNPVLATLLPHSSPDHLQDRPDPHQLGAAAAARAGAHARRTLAQVRLQPHPAAAPALRLQRGRLLSHARGAEGPHRGGLDEHPADLHQRLHPPGGRSPAGGARRAEADHHHPGRRGSLHLPLHGGQGRLRLDQRDARGAREQVRHPRCHVPAGHARAGLTRSPTRRSPR